MTIPVVRLAEIVDASNAVAGSASRLQKIARLADLLAQTRPDETEIAVSFLSGAPRQGRIGVGGAAIVEARDVLPSAESSLGLAEVDEAFGQVARRRQGPDRRGFAPDSCAASSSARRGTSRIFWCACCSASCGRAPSRAC